MKKLILLLLLITNVSTTFAQQADSVAMADQFRADGKIYVVIGVLSIIFAGILFFLLRIERRLKQLEKNEGLK